MARWRRPPSQGWTTFLHNHADGIVAMDLFVVPTISFRLLYGLLILRHDRRRILWLGALFFAAPPFLYPFVHDLVIFGPDVRPLSQDRQAEGAPEKRV